MLIAWPGWSIQQDLGPLSGTVGTFRIWMSADPEAYKDLTLSASLIDASSRDVLRQVFTTVSRRYVPVAHTVSFPGFVVPPGKRLMLQLGVPELQQRHVIYRLAHPDPARSNVMLNGVPDSGNGPLAFAHIRTGSGMRAAADGDVSSRLRLSVALAMGALALAARPRVALEFARFTRGAQGQVGQQLVRMGRAVTTDSGRAIGSSSFGVHRLLASPWYPWPAATVPILHYVASNPLHFEMSESIAPLVVVQAAVTIGVVGLRLWLRDWHRPAAICAVCIVVFFGYGHIAGAIDGRHDDRVTFAVAAVFVATVAHLIIHRGASAVRLAPFLNLMTAILLVFPIAGVVTDTAMAQRSAASSEPESLEDLAAHLLPAGLPDVSVSPPDIYYIILDSYPRHDVLLDYYHFDNSHFLRDLERRGFYVARGATSNYRPTHQSIPSVPNMAYLDGLGQRVPSSLDELAKLARYNSVAALLKSVGYTYVHLDTGYVVTDTSPLADRVISFTTSGTIVRTGTDARVLSASKTGTPLLSDRFIRGLIQTTALSVVFADRTFFVQSVPLEWWSPRRANLMFEYLSSPIDAENPKFVFAHIVKPHAPYTFDQYGNFVGEKGRFDDLHDPSVPSAYIGQLKYVNRRALEMIDGILQHSQPDSPIIVITGDHGGEFEGADEHAILSAFHLPNRGSDRLYGTISLVNHFRVIFDSYLGTRLGLLEDLEHTHSTRMVDFGI